MRNHCVKRVKVSKTAISHILCIHPFTSPSSTLLHTPSDFAPSTPFYYGLMYDMLRNILHHLNRKSAFLNAFVLTWWTFNMSMYWFSQLAINYSHTCQQLWQSCLRLTIVFVPKLSPFIFIFYQHERGPWIRRYLLVNTATIRSVMCDCRKGAFEWRVLS